MIRMGKKCLVLCLLAAVLLCIAGIAYAATEGVVDVDKLMLREEPNAQSKALQTLSRGDKVDIIYKDGSWYKVEYGRYEGFVYAIHVKVSGKVDSADDVVSLKKGDYGPEVMKLQKRLKELGYFEGTCTYTFGEKTEAAVKAFQERHGLKADGIAGAKTLDKLYSSSAKKASSSVSTGNGSSSSTSSGSQDETLRHGMSGSAVKKLQERLKELGYFDHSVTGYYGDVTKKAVEAFQKNNGLKVDGVAGPATLKKVYSSSAKKAGSSSSSSSSDDTETLRYGMRSDAVEKLQRRLKYLGYFDHSCTGYYGTITVDAVEAFERRNGLKIDGICDAATLEAIYSSDAKYAAKPEEDEDEDEADGTLRYGMSGSEVKKLQQRLKELGYFNTTCTGYYGGITETAVKDFQRRNGLSVTGIADAKTQAKLYASSAKPAEDEEAATPSQPSDDDTSLTVGDSGDEVRALQTRLYELGYFNHEITGYYGSVTADAVKAFQRRNGLTVTGVANEATMKKLLSSSAIRAESGTYITERLDWFNGGASVIPRGAIFKIKDVRTGLIFTAKRQGGGYHMDAEPLTAADTAILLRINGGVEFSWRRRPMLVLYNGHVYACSIYSEPHGDDTIPGNDFNGQFCLHFYGSKTHGTDRVDPDHAACEREALRATW